MVTLMWIVITLSFRSIRAGRVIRWWKALHLPDPSTFLTQSLFAFLVALRFTIPAQNFSQYQLISTFTLSPIGSYSAPGTLEVWPREKVEALLPRRNF